MGCFQLVGELNWRPFEICNRCQLPLDLSRRRFFPPSFFFFVFIALFQSLWLNGPSHRSFTPRLFRGLFTDSDRLRSAFSAVL